MDLSAKFGKERIDKHSRTTAGNFAYSTAMFSGFHAKTKVRITILVEVNKMDISSLTF
jgi:hypothetical protein